ncbi:MAG: SLBB domain-containing protein, partial [Clostridia bacterium]|nr:SLBB domain-containing protein [Clostridia bacterium]
DVIYIPEAREQAAILGEVARPGVYPVGRDVTLMDLLAAAGGPTAKADLSVVKVYRGANTADPLTLAVAGEALLYEGDVKANPVIEPGSVVIVASAAIRVQAAGFVGRPGQVELLRGASVLDAVAAAGGLRADGDGTAVVLTRRGPSGATVSEIDVEGLLAGRVTGAPPTVEDGDALFVPEARGQALVMGEVARPGAYRLPRGARLMDAIAAAGGPTAKASLENVTVYAGGDASKGASSPIGAGKELFTGDANKDNPVLGVGDIIVVGSRVVAVNVIGRVARPGAYELPAGAKVVDAIAAAGGLAAGADGRAAVLTRKAVANAKPGSLAVDAEAVLRDQKSESNYALAEGDVIYIPEAREQAAILGEVARPGVYPVGRDVTLMDLLAAAGGPTAKADLSIVKVYRGENTADPLTLAIAGETLLYEGDVKANPVIQPGSVVIVASAAIRVQAAGFVGRPGQVELLRGASVLDAVAAAGGLRADGDGTAVVLTRRGPSGATVAEIDIEGLLAGRVTGAPPTVEDGDALFVPEARGQVLVLGEVARPGAYKLPRGAKLLDAIAAAGGTTARASLESVTIYKDGALASGAAEPIGHGGVLFSGKVTDNPAVNPGDVVSVGSRMITVSVIGKVGRPGAYEIPAGARVIDAVAAAGGIAPDGNGRSVLVIPAGKSGPSATVDLDQALRGGDIGHTLSDGDVVFISDTRRQVAVMGEVTRPGVYVYTEGMTLMEALAMAGGPSAKADLDRVRLYRGERVEDALRLSVADDRLAFEGDIKRNPTLTAGDILFVPSGRIRVQVAGHIIRTGEFELRRGATILDAISAAGGLTQAGDGARVVITRRGESASRVVEADVEGLLSGDSPQSEAMALEDGDVVFVPEALRRIVVMGGVARPGLYDYKTGMKLIDSLAMAGGPMAAARLDKIMVYTGEQAVQIALGDTTAKGIAIDPTKGSNPELKSGDIVIVPLSEKIDWNMIISILSVVNQIKAIITR